MAYKISYGQEPKTKRKPGGKWIAGLVLLALGILARLMRWDEQLRQLLIPGNAAVTAAAFENMLAQLKQGQTVIEAFGGFCREVIQGAKIY